MGIYDREYYRDSTRGSGWLSGVAPACKTIIIINVVMFVAQKLTYEPLTDHDKVSDWLQAGGVEIFQKFQIWRLFTATFLHDGPFHILFNMLFFWMVGREMESFYGMKDFVALYVSAAIVSTLVWAISDQYGPNHGMGHMIGASGAVLAVVVLYTLYYPKREIIVVIFPVEMWLFLVLYLGFNLLSFVGGSQERTAFASHLGGAAFGYLFKVGDLRLTRLEKLFQRKPRLRIVSAEPRETSSGRPSTGPTWSSIAPASARPASTAVVSEEKFDERLDEILVKIAREGRGMLTEDENRVLEEASRRARSRRSERI